MNNNYSYDLLIFGARPEELWFLHSYFRKSLGIGRAKLPQDELCEDIDLVINYKGMKIGLVCVNEMGNVSAALKAYQVIDRMLPRAVLMTGLSAAVSEDVAGNNALKYCDVGISDSIQYYSYSKKETHDAFPKVRDAGVYLTDINAKDIKRVTHSEILFQQEVNNVLKDWWEDPDYNFNKWIIESVDARDKKDYETKQCSPHKLSETRETEAPIEIVSGVCYASGETLIADEGYVSRIRDAFGGPNYVRMIDMESYGMSKACHAFNVPYLTVKGVSDYAGKEKSDKYRWMSIAAASLTCIKLIDKGLIDMTLKQIPRRRYNNSACLLPTVEPLCPERMRVFPNSRWRYRDCLDELLGRFPSRAPVGSLARVHEDLIPEWYSRDLADVLLNSYDPDKQRLTFFFPYDGMDLMEFFANEEEDTDVTELVSDIRKIRKIYNPKGRGKQKEDREKHLINKIKALTDKLTVEYKHFKKMDEICSTFHMGTEVPDICRVIVFDNGHHIRRDEIVNDPINYIYPSLLGRNVPTYYTTTNILKNNRLPFPDAIYVASKNNKRRFHTVLRYSNNSHSLIVSGIPCEIVPPECDDVSELGINTLYTFWNEWIEEMVKGHTVSNDFALFPSEEIVKRFADQL